ncbi:hypothetical protein B0H19DRAFT_1181681 [Mycena capillaripes]|nr:hypothetical protein B0H19DRAFT_1181681 [Mycena capillaripes]
MLLPHTSTMKTTGYFRAMVAVFVLSGSLLVSGIPIGLIDSQIPHVSNMVTLVSNEVLKGQKILPRQSFFFADGYTEPDTAADS